MAESWVQIPPDSNGKRLRSLTHTVGAEEVHSHTTALIDPATGDPLGPSTEATLEAVRGHLSTLEARTSSAAKDFLDGKFRSGGGEQPITASGDGWLQLENPAGSGVTLLVVNFVLTLTQDGVVNFWHDATLDTPTLLESFNPNRAYEAAPTAAILRRSDSASGGTQLSPVYRLAQNIGVDKDYTELLLPGQSIAVQGSSGLLESMSLYASATWIEDPL